MTMLRAVLLPVLLLLALAAPAAAQEQAPVTGISVVGEAEGFVDNDVATFRFGVTVRRRTPAAALQRTSARTAAVVDVVRAGGVAAEDVRTAVVSVRRSDRTVGRGKRARRVRSYVATNAIRVTVRRVADAGGIVTRAVRAGATSVSGPSFEASTFAEAYRRTLAAAYADARAKAQRLADEAGVRLGRPVRIRESGADDFDPAPAQSGGGEDQAAAGEVDTPVQPGRTRVFATVAVVFSIE